MLISEIGSADLSIDKRAALALTDFTKATDSRANLPESLMALNYLSVFGYLAKELAGWVDITLGDIVNALASFQKFFGIRQTGQLCTSTVRAMELYRCGLPDIVQADHPSSAQALRIQHFVEVNMARWRKTSIKYCIEKYVDTLPVATQDQIIDQAFAAWEKRAAIHITRAEVSEPCDILIGTGQGPRDNFDGAGGILAWCYLPDGSDEQLLMKFDAATLWLVDPNQRGILMLNVATHEFGHALGLTHSEIPSALMAPYYNASVGTPQDNDDVARLVARYGLPLATESEQPPPSVPSKTQAPEHVIVISGKDVTITFDGDKLL